MFARITCAGNVKLTLTPDEALGIATLLGKLDTFSGERLGISGNSYDTLADALEYGENAPFPLDDAGRSIIYDRLPRVTLTVHDNA